MLVLSPTHLTFVIFAYSLCNFRIHVSIGHRNLLRIKMCLVKKLSILLIENPTGGLMKVFKKKNQDAKVDLNPIALLDPPGAGKR